MRKISVEDYRSLELKIQTEITKIFSEFMEDLENKAIEPDEPVTAQEQQKPCPPCKIVPAEKMSAPAERSHRKPKKPIEMDRILHSTPHTETKSTGKILEEDMEKIFRKKHRRGSH